MPRRLDHQSSSLSAAAAASGVRAARGTTRVTSLIGASAAQLRCTPPRGVHAAGERRIRLHRQDLHVAINTYRYTCIYNVPSTMARPHLDGSCVDLYALDGDGRVKGDGELLWPRVCQKFAGLHACMQGEGGACVCARVRAAVQAHTGTAPCWRAGMEAGRTRGCRFHGQLAHLHCMVCTYT